MDIDIGPLLDFAKARHDIYLRRQRGDPPPWTNDPILQRYHFCNVYRECDRVTKWIADNWRDSHADDPDLWFAMAMARNVNWPDTLDELGYPVPWNSKRFLRVMKDRTERGERVYNNAYMLRCDKSHAGQPKYVYQAEAQYGPWWKDRKRLRPWSGQTLDEYHIVLMDTYGFGSFMAGQVVADLKYVKPLLGAWDWMTFVASGPGSKRGLNYLLGRAPNEPWRESAFRDWVSLVQILLNAEWPFEKLHAQDVQNLLCEYSKLVKIRRGTGRMREFHPYVLTKDIAA